MNQLTNQQINYLCIAGRSIAPIHRGGKSGQRRASHFLTGRILSNQNTDSAAENYRPDNYQDKGENVR